MGLNQKTKKKIEKGTFDSEIFLDEKKVKKVKEKEAVRGGTWCFLDFVSVKPSGPLCEIDK